VFGSKPSDQTIRQARDIIAKWSASDLLDRISTLPEIPSMPAPHISFIQKTEASQTEYRKVEVPDFEPPEALQPTDDPSSNIAVVGPSNMAETEQQTRESPVELPIVATEDLTAEEPASPAQDDVAEVEELQPDTPTEQIVAEILAPAEVAGLLLENDPEPENDLEEKVEQPDQQQKITVAAAAPDTRKEQPRQPQMRKQRERTRPDAAQNKGLKPVSRKLRVDSPGDAERDIERAPAAETNAPSDMNVAGGRIQSNSTNTGRRHRIDNGQPVSATIGTGDSRTRTHGKPRRRYIDEAHPATARGPHFQVTPQRRTNFTSMTGQFLAYIGVLGLTIGTAMVIYGHFGGYSDYTPTGWLVTTVAQMMLFLGVINLVSGGMEQTNHDVSQRINTLGEQLLRIEQVTEQALRGPKISPRRYADPDGQHEESQREMAAIRDAD